MVEVVQMFCEEMNKVKKELNNKRPYLSLQYPKYSGQAHWIRALKRRLDNNFKVIQFLLPFPIGFLGTIVVNLLEILSR